MLLQFTVKNFLSFRDETIFKMTASSDSKHPNHVQEHAAHAIRVLKCAAIYGPNGSGKTNLIEALEFLKDLVIRGTKPNQGITVRKFKLKKEALTEPSSFELEILHEDIHYSYGILVDEYHIKEEWLFSTKPEGREVRLFERITSQDGTVTVEFGPQIFDKDQDKDFLSFVAKGTRPEQPFLTEAESRNVKTIAGLMKWFRTKLGIQHCSAIYEPLPLRIHNDKNFTKTLGAFLKAIGTGIEKVVTEEIDLDFEKQFPDMPTDARQEILSNLDGKTNFVISVAQYAEDLTFITGTKDNPKTVKIFTVHKADDSTDVRFSFSEESAGTQRAIHLFPALLSMSISDKVFVIDELDRSLHPMLSRMFVESFLKLSNSKSQLIFTTHEECLLDLDLLRRDEIWFIEKDSEQVSHCYPLTDFKVRTDLEIRKGYLHGRFGAIPFFQDLQSLGWVEAKK